MTLRPEIYKYTVSYHDNATGKDIEKTFVSLESAVHFYDNLAYVSCRTLAAYERTILSYERGYKTKNNKDLTQDLKADASVYSLSTQENYND